MEKQLARSGGLNDTFDRMNGKLDWLIKAIEELKRAIENEGSVCTGTSSTKNPAPVPEIPRATVVDLENGSTEYVADVIEEVMVEESQEMFDEIPGTKVSPTDVVSFNEEVFVLQEHQVFEEITVPESKFFVEENESKWCSIAGCIEQIHGDSNNVINFCRRPKMKRKLRESYYEVPPPLPEPPPLPGLLVVSTINRILSSGDSVSRIIGSSNGDFVFKVEKQSLPEIVVFRGDKEKAQKELSMVLVLFKNKDKMNDPLGSIGLPHYKFSRFRLGLGEEAEKTSKTNACTMSSESQISENSGMGWHILGQGKQRIGRYTISELQEHYSSKYLSMRTLVWSERCRDWQPLSSILGLSTDDSWRIGNTLDGVQVTILTRNSKEKVELCRFSKYGTEPFLFGSVQRGNKQLTMFREEMQIIKFVSECLQDNFLLVKSYIVERLSDICKVSCMNGSSNSTENGDYDWSVRKVLRCFYDKDCRSDTSIRSLFLFLIDVSGGDKVTKWVGIFSGFDNMEVKPLEKMLEQKQRVQRDITLTEDEGNFHILYQIKDSNVWKLWTELLDLNTSSLQASSSREEMLKILRDKRRLYEFLNALSLKLSYLLVDKESASMLCRLIVDKYPYCTYAYLRLAAITKAQNNVQVCLKWICDALKLDEKRPIALLLLGKLELKNHDWINAKEPLLTIKNSTDGKDSYDVDIVGICLLRPRPPPEPPPYQSSTGFSGSSSHHTHIQVLWSRLFEVGRYVTKQADATSF